MQATAPDGDADENESRCSVTKSVLFELHANFGEANGVACSRRQYGEGAWHGDGAGMTMLASSAIVRFVAPQLIGRNAQATLSSFRGRRDPSHPTRINRLVVCLRNVVA
jgi:hypothetical protein